MAPTTNKPAIKNRPVDPVSANGNVSVNTKSRTVLRSLLRIGLLFVLLVAIVASAIVGAVYYQVFDPGQLAEKWGVKQHPLVGQLLETLPVKQPDAVVERTMGDGEPVPPAKALVPETPAVLPRPAENGSPIQTDVTELTKQAEQKQEEERKRLTKVARLYDSMKPEAAVPIMRELDDETIILIFSKMDEERVAKILTLFDPQRAARISEAILKGRVNG